MWEWIRYALLFTAAISFFYWVYRLVSEPISLVTCLMCGGEVNYLTRSIGGIYKSVCQECADREWQTRNAQ